ncbi:MAG: tRNA (guanosine(46)-N7)-methyltransferase TrmB [Pseudomonadales bacterium]|nr:tRNA (guanosine(46)-N7)-methyltransferase TrmB [Pseudomonadales bacterium]NIX07606.1 tRNA (guanosine(46)-N7)-methyltransferase TrmB [Pseudomonadales bacterium]
MTRGQARALDRVGGRLIVDATTSGWASVFGRDAPLGVEIGFGMGHALLDWAAECPDWNLVGVEVYQPGIGALLLGLDDRGLNNVRVLEADARQALSVCFEPDSIDELRILFPDPWPKKRHHKRRLVQPEFVRLLASRLRPGGRLVVATDWQEYAQSMLKTLDEEPLLLNRFGPGTYGARPSSRPTTRFEERGRRLGHGVWDLGYERKREITESR